jgi:hypothetical protein
MMIVFIEETGIYCQCFEQLLARTLPLVAPQVGSVFPSARRRGLTAHHNETPFAA